MFLKIFIVFKTSDHKVLFYQLYLRKGNFLFFFLFEKSKTGNRPVSWQRQTIATKCLVCLNIKKLKVNKV